MSKTQITKHLQVQGFTTLVEAKEFGIFVRPRADNAGDFAIRCGTCGVISHNFHDVRNHYCVNCHKFHDDVGLQSRE